jgi:hypothetical protein
MSKKKYEIEMDGEAVIAISFSDPIAARTFLASISALAVMSPEEVDVNDIIAPLKEHAMSFCLVGRDEEAIRRIREE